MREAIISAEDERFLDHNGVDPIATLRAAYRDITGGQLQGGSTITQQYVKNVYVGNDRTLRPQDQARRRSRVRLESRKSKEEILTDYLNVLYLGNGVYGVQAAAKYYFGVDVRDLDLDEGDRAARPGPGAGPRLDARRHRAGAVGVEPGPRLRRWPRCASATRSTAW